MSGVFVLASTMENSPNALGEAMLLGLPCVATRTGGVPSLLEDKKEGLLYPPCDVAALTEALLQIFSEKVIASVYGDNARKRAMLTHDAARNVKELIHVYHRMMEGTGDEA